MKTATRLKCSEKGIRRAGKVPAGFHYIDGNDGDFDERPLEERRMLAEYGVLLISAGVDRDLAKIAQPVTVSARGWFEGASDADVTRTPHDRGSQRSPRRRLPMTTSMVTRSPKVAQRAAGRLLGQRYRRQPVILSSVLEF